MFNSCTINTQKENKDKGLIYNKRISFDTINYIPYQTSFVFFNSSNDTVFIDTVTYSCTCVKILNKFIYISPKTIDSITISLSSENGYINRYISVILEEQQEPITLILDGYINVK
jgi:hypothetical protein